MNTEVKCNIIEASSNKRLYQIEVHNGLIPAYIVKKHDGPIPYIHIVALVLDKPLAAAKALVDELPALVEEIMRIMKNKPASRKWRNRMCGMTCPSPNLLTWEGHDWLASSVTVLCQSLALYPLEQHTFLGE